MDGKKTMNSCEEGETKKSKRSAVYYIFQTWTVQSSGNCLRTSGPVRNGQTWNDCDQCPGPNKTHSF